MHEHNRAMREVARQTVARTALELVPAQEPSGRGTARASQRRCADGIWLMYDKILGESYMLVRTHCPASQYEHLHEPHTGRSGLQCLHVSSAYQTQLCTSA